jgi:hypothetical protein
MRQALNENPVAQAYDDGRAVAVLITRMRGIEDKRLRATLSRIEAAGDVAMFHAYARDIARYSRITGRRGHQPGPGPGGDPPGPRRALRGTSQPALPSAVVTARIAGALRAR